MSRVASSPGTETTPILLLWAAKKKVLAPGSWYKQTMITGSGLPFMMTAALLPVYVLQRVVRRTPRPHSCTMFFPPSLSWIRLVLQWVQGLNKVYYLHFMQHSTIQCLFFRIYNTVKSLKSGKISWLFFRRLCTLQWWIPSQARWSHGCATVQTLAGLGSLSWQVQCTVLGNYPCV